MNKLNFNTTLKVGSSGNNVKQLQEALELLGLESGEVDGVFGNNTLLAVKKLQEQKGLEVDGVVGTGTIAAINNAFSKLGSTSSATPKPIIDGFGGKSGKLPLAAISLIKEFEGCYLNAYPDPLSGNLPITIGYGCTKKFDGSNWHLGESITQSEADDLLLRQLEESYLPPMQNNIPVWNELNANQQAALLSFGYNLGAHFYNASGFESMTRMLKDKAFHLVEETFLKYRNPGSNVEAGLKRRRLAEAKLFNSLHD